MPLSPETIEQLKEAKFFLEQYKALRLSEIEDLVANLKQYGVPLESLSAKTKETAADESLARLQDLLG
jgi:hypothetical protein